MEKDFNLIPLDWYSHPPIDFEHKEYVLLAYLKLVDSKFYDRVFSPFLLHTENLVREMRWIALNIRSFESSMERKGISTDGDTFRIVTYRQARPEEIEIMLDVVDYSIPFLQRSLDLGKKLMGNGPILLY